MLSVEEHVGFLYLLRVCRIPTPDQKPFCIDEECLTPRPRLTKELGLERFQQLSLVSSSGLVGIPMQIEDRRYGNEARERGLMREAEEARVRKCLAEHFEEG
jgi:hypothetical protein